MNKYNAQKTTVYGMEFDSRKEAQRYMVLRAWEKEGRIHDLQRQVEFQLIPKQEDSRGKTIRACVYVADFVYRDQLKNLVVEDVKGLKTGAAYEIFKLKKKLMLWIHHIEVVEV